MRTVTKEYGIYFFDELPEELQKEVIAERSDYYVQDEWWDSTYENWKYKLEMMGFENIDISFSGFSSQGDGASFTARCDHQKILNTLFMCNEQNIGNLNQWRLWFELVENGPYFRFQVKRIIHHYVHENTIEPSIEEDMSCFTQDIYEATNEKGQKYYTSVFDEKVNLRHLEEMFSDFVKDLCREIYYSLEKNYEYLKSEEFIKEELMNSDDEFKVDMETMELV